MNAKHALAGALVCACLSFVAPAQAQTALEFATSGMGASPAVVACRASSSRARRCASLDRRFAHDPALPRDIRPALQIVAEAARYIGARNPMRFRGPGCKAFVNMVARRAGFAVNASMRAFDVAGMGQRVSYPQPGDYRVSARRGGGHIELVARVEGGAVVTINGNKGGNRVGWSHRAISGAAYYRPLRSASI